MSLSRTSASSQIRTTRTGKTAARKGCESCGGNDCRAGIARGARRTVRRADREFAFGASDRQQCSLVGGGGVAAQKEHAVSGSRSSKRRWVSCTLRSTGGFWSATSASHGSWVTRRRNWLAQVFSRSRHPRIEEKATPRRCGCSAARPGRSALKSAICAKTAD